MPNDTTFSDLLASHEEGELRNALLLATNQQLAPVATPRSAATGGSLVPYNTTQYEREKRQGIRKTNGARKLKKLSNRHLRIISMHLEGNSGEYIAAVMRVTVITVSRILNDPLAINLLGTIYKDRQGEIDALAGKAIEAVRDGLHEKRDMRIRLGAVDKYTKLKDSIGKEETSAKTAEDVVAEIFNRVTLGNTNIQVNIGKGNG